MESILVTGGAGFIGSVVGQTLLERGHSVLVLDSLEEGHREAVSDQAVFFQGNIGDEALLKRIFGSYPVSAVIHLAAFCQVGESVQDPEKYYLNNVANGLTLLKVMRASGVRKMVFSSTAAVYGEPQALPITETHPTQPINPYGRSKLIFEQILEGYARAYGLKYCAFRYFNAAGASELFGEDHSPESHLIPLVLGVPLKKIRPSSKSEGEPGSLKVFGRDYPTPDGSCVRDYIHIQDLALAHCQALERLDTLPERIFNLGNGRGFSVLEVIETARRVTGMEIPFEVVGRRPGDPAVLVASSDRARAVLNWEPAFPDLEAIVASAWKWRQRFPGGYGDRLDSYIS